MIQHTILMPYSRPKNFQTLREHMEGQGVTWVPLYDSDECHALLATKDQSGVPAPSAGLLPDWIKPWRGDLPKRKGYDPGEVGPGKDVPTVNPGHWMCDTFLDLMKMRDGDGLHYQDQEGDLQEFFRKDHYVSFMTDDCLWNWNYWRKLQRHFVKRGPKDQEYNPAVIISAHRIGGNIIYPQHRRPHEPFHQSTCTTFCTRFEALTVRADKLRDVRFGSFWAGDGIVVERLVEENIGQMPESVAMASDCLVYWNALSPEAWGFPATHQR